MRPFVGRADFVTSIVLASMASLSIAPLAVAQTQRQIDWTPETGMDHQIFPSATISTATSKVPFVYLNVNVSNVTPGALLVASVKSDSLIEASSAEVTVPAGVSHVAIPIKATWKFEKLAGIQQQIPANFTYSLTVDGQKVGDKVDTAIVHSVNDCPFALRDSSGVWKPLHPLFMAYVNEDHPKIDKLLKDALATGIVKKFDGYQQNDPKAVWAQIYAIWHALQLKGIKYSDITVVPEKSDIVHSQHVRFLDESIDNAQANCVDGSILFASVLQRIGIESALAVTPHHMFVVFYTEKDRKGIAAIETTLLGQVDLPKDGRNNILDNFLEPKWRTNASAKTLEVASRVGGDEYNKLGEAQKKQISEHSKEFVGGIIFVSDARKAGIMPIPYDFTKKP